jgi:putative transposase
MEDAELVAEIHEAVIDLPSYGYHHVWGVIRSNRETHGAVPVNVKRIYRVMRVHGLLLQRRPKRPTITRRHDGRVAVARSNLERPHVSEDTRTLLK